MTLYMLFAIAAILIYTGVASVVAATGGPGDARAINASNKSPAVVVAESARALAAGEQLFMEFGCSGCHRPDGKGLGPSLLGVFGRPATAPGCGALTVDAEYVREAILNPSSTVAAGFAPVMPTFSGRVTEEQLGALIAYVASLSVPMTAPRKPDGESR